MADSNSGQLNEILNAVSYIQNKYRHENIMLPDLWFDSRNFINLIVELQLELSKVIKRIKAMGIEGILKSNNFYLLRINLKKLNSMILDIRRNNYFYKPETSQEINNLTRYILIKLEETDIFLILRN